MSGTDVGQVAWLEPWSPLVDSRHAAKLERELTKEVARGHVLFGRVARALAVRGDQDEVLFEVANPVQFAVVHLSWVAGSDRSPWPRTTLFQTIAEFVDTRMTPDHEEFGVAR
jgi:hypothetical protein